MFDVGLIAAHYFLNETWITLDQFSKEKVHRTTIPTLMNIIVRPDDGGRKDL
jgi:hypothetical protein